MERLTCRRNDAGFINANVLLRGKRFGPAFFPDKQDYKDYSDALERLAQYEDAEEAGKLVMLPFGVGKQIFSTRYGEVETGTVWQVEINSYTSPAVWIRFTVQSKLFGPMDGHTRIDLAARDGIYFTREEAEKEVKMVKNEQDNR